jgi:hypothetical protein
MGPLDFGRSVYNSLIGDTPVLKQQLLDYSRMGIRKNFPKASDLEVEQTLAKDLECNLDGPKINSQLVGIGKLWDLSEEYARNQFERKIWPFVGDKNPSFLKITK